MNPTPRKCRGHKYSRIIKNERCMKCGGVVEIEILVCEVDDKGKEIGQWI